MKVHVTYQIQYKVQRGEWRLFKENTSLCMARSKCGRCRSHSAVLGHDVRWRIVRVTTEVVK